MSGAIPLNAMFQKMSVMHRYRIEYLSADGCSSTACPRLGHKPDGPLRGSNGGVHTTRQVDDTAMGSNSSTAQTAPRDSCCPRRNLRAARHANKLVDGAAQRGGPGGLVSEAQIRLLAVATRWRVSDPHVRPVGGADGVATDRMHLEEGIHAAHGDEHRCRVPTRPLWPELRIPLTVILEGSSARIRWLLRRHGRTTRVWRNQWLAGKNLYTDLESEENNGHVCRPMLQKVGRRLPRCRAHWSAPIATSTEVPLVFHGAKQVARVRVASTHDHNPLYLS
mmetsp:Transcript_19327/g.51446  ORF Transcript_19327/g.51446 Transcript_19327/m.51446 type:complete len:279 (+) Transcript_19327:304-1140(+)